MTTLHHSSVPMGLNERIQLIEDELAITILLLGYLMRNGVWSKDEMTMLVTTHNNLAYLKANGAGRQQLAAGIEAAFLHGGDVPETPAKPEGGNNGTTERNGRQPS